MKKIRGYVFTGYINKVIDRYECNLIKEDKFNRMLDTYQRWEREFSRMKAVDQHELVEALEELI